ncbi:hypothetical protein BC834DRAFT_454643 [Gloeopeniophorella convolvens]|nr:hypothetical protein BC834DRAFT_454643 [Gloeopeniophorella convolvens]
MSVLCWWLTFVSPVPIQTLPSKPGAGLTESSRVEAAAAHTPAGLHSASSVALRRRHGSMPHSVHCTTAGELEPPPPPRGAPAPARADASDRLVWCRAAPLKLLLASGTEERTNPCGPSRGLT